MTAMRPRAASLKRLHKERLTRLKLNLGVLVLGEFRGVLNFLTTRLLAHLPQDLGHLACNLRRTAEDDRCITRLENTRVLLHGNNGSESLDWFKITIFLDVNDISRVDLFVLADTLDRETNRVSRAGLLEGLLVLFDGEDLLVAKTTGDNSNDITRQESALLNSSADNLPNTLDVVNVGNRKANRKLRMTLGRDNKVI